MRNSLIAVIVCVICLAAVVLSTNARSWSDGSNASAVVAELEQQAVKADLATDRSFYEAHLADNWTGGSSFGEWESKASLLKDMSDRQNHRIERESISDMTVRVYGSTAVATYKQSYEMFDHGRRHARVVITTDTWVKQNGTWQEVASHSSETK